MDRLETLYALTSRVVTLNLEYTPGLFAIEQILEMIFPDDIEARIEACGAMADWLSGYYTAETVARHEAIEAHLARIGGLEEFPDEFEGAVCLSCLEVKGPDEFAGDGVCIACKILAAEEPDPEIDDPAQALVDSLTEPPETPF